MRLTISRVCLLWQERLLQKGLSSKTIKSYRTLFTSLANFLLEHYSKVWDLRNISRQDGLNYLLYLKQRKLGYGTRRLAFKVAQQIIRFLWKQKLILTDPWASIEIRYRKNKIRICLEEDEVQRFLDSIIPDSYWNLRDRALFELMYSSGLRPFEAGQVKRQDIDVKERLLLVRQGKFGKDRIVPVTMAAMKHIELLLASSVKEYLFGPYGHKPLGSTQVGYRFKLRVQAAGLYREGLTAHSLRHSCARHLLAHGADIRYVQKLLGHQSIETTVLYTYELTEQLKKTFRRYHPREGLLYKEVDESYRKRIDVLRISLEKCYQRRLTRRPITSLEIPVKDR